MASRTRSLVNLKNMYLAGCLVANGLKRMIRRKLIPYIQVPHLTRNYDHRHKRHDTEVANGELPVDIITLLQTHSTVDVAER